MVFTKLSAETLSKYFPESFTSMVETIQTYLEVEGKVLGLLGKRKMSLYFYFRDFDPDDSESYVKVTAEECLVQAISSCEDLERYYEQCLFKSKRGSRQYETVLSKLYRVRRDLKALRELEK